MKPNGGADDCLGKGRSGLEADLMQQVLARENLRRAWEQVRANRGAPGIDGMTVKELNGHLLQHWPKIHGKLMAGTYVPSPGRRGEIPKPNGGTRGPGIPTGLDRFTQEVLLQVMGPTRGPRFREHS